MELSQDGMADTSVEVFKGLGDPVRWSILRQVAAADGLACATLEQTLPVSKPTISYHTKILQQAGLISARKEGRNYYYDLRRETLRDALDDLWLLVPDLFPATGKEPVSDDRPPSRRRRRDQDEVAPLTW